MAYQTSKKSPLGCFIFLAFIILVGLIHGAVRYFTDKPMYEEAHTAYLTGDCDKAIPLYNEIIHKFRALDFKAIKEKSITEVSDCSLYRVATEGGLEGLYKFTQDFPGNPLEEVTAAKASELLHGFTDTSDLTIALGGESCQMQEQLESAGWLTRDDTLPLYLYHCSRFLMQHTRNEAAFAQVSTLMREFPQHPLTENIWASLGESAAFCGILQSDEIMAQNTQRIDSLPEIYLACGRHYTDEDDVPNARWVFEDFLAAYPDHPEAAQVNQTLALLLIEDAKASGSGTIERPDSSGWAPSGVARVVIQNDSPHQLKLVFSGVDARIETLAACETCVDFSTIGPMYCPELGPVATYELTPGTYEVLVEAADEGGVIPFTGTWELQGGNEFYSCFFVVTTWN